MNFEGIYSSSPNKNQFHTPQNIISITDSMFIYVKHADYFSGHNIPGICRCKIEHVISCPAGSGEALSNYSYFKFDHHHANASPTVPLILYSLYGINQTDPFINHKSVCLVIGYNSYEYYCYSICVHWFDQALELLMALLGFLFCQCLDLCCNSLLSMCRLSQQNGCLSVSLILILLSLSLSPVQPIADPPPSKKYVRCPCNCLLTCSSTASRVICPRPNW